MIVTCEKCDTKFNLDERLVKSTGTKVRCSKCKHIFITYPPKPSEEEVLEESVDLEAATGGDSDTFTTGESDFSDEQGVDETSSEADAPDDMDLSDIEKMLEVEEDAEEEVAAEDDLRSDGAGFDAVGDSLDLSDIEEILDNEAIEDDLTEDKTDEDEDLVFDLDEALEVEAGEEQISPTSELDLGDLEKMFESEEEEPDFSLEDESGLSNEIEAGDAASDLLSMEEDDASEDLELEMEEETETSDLESDESEETLNFDMEDIEESEAPQPSSEEDVQELDFDLEEIEEDLSEGPRTEAADIEFPDSDGDMDIKLELEEETESDVSEIEESELTVEDEASEVADLDAVLETEETTGDFLESVADLEEEKISEEAAEDELGEPEEESFDGSDDEPHDDEPSDLDEETEIDFPDDAVPDIPDEEESLMDEEGPTQEEDFGETEDVAEVTEDISISQLAEEKSGLKKFVVWLLMVVAVIVIVLGVLVFLQLRGVVSVPYLDQVELPFLGKLEAPGIPDPGNLNINITSDPDARFLEGGKAGKLFIVTGKVKNSYDHPRSYIQVSGSLYTRGAILAQTVNAYCGNVLPDLELIKMDASEIQTRMENRSGESNSNVNVKPGKELSFMIVFSDFPESLEEYTVTVVGSSANGG